MIVLVHGVPETASFRDPLLVHLPAETLAVQLPGFGCPRPEGFAATPGAYAGWLISELEQLGRPVDLVGHDWGAALPKGGADCRARQGSPDTSLPRSPATRPEQQRADAPSRTRMLGRL